MFSRIMRGTIVLVLVLSLTTCSWADLGFSGLGGFPGGTSSHSIPVATSADGSIVVGWSGSGLTDEEGFRWTDSTPMTTLGPSTTVTGISADGTVIAGISGSYAFRWTQSNGLQSLSFSRAYDVSGDGTVIVGQAGDQPLACLWDQVTGLTRLGDLPGDSDWSEARAVSDNGQLVVGDSRSSNGDEAFIWAQSTGMTGLGDLPGGEFSSHADDISADGSIVVGNSVSALGREAMSWSQSGGMVGLGDLDGGDYLSKANAVSADGSVIVGWGTSALGTEAVIWQGSDAIRTVRDFLETDYGLDIGLWELETATGISNDGKTIVGYGTNPDGQTEGWVLTIPEPGSIALFSVLGLLVRRRKKT